MSNSQTLEKLISHKTIVHPQIGSPSARVHRDAAKLAFQRLLPRGREHDKSMLKEPVQRNREVILANDLVHKTNSGCNGVIDGAGRIDAMQNRLEVCR